MQLGGAEGFGGILQRPLRFGPRIGELLEVTHMVGDELHHLRDVHAKHHAPPGGRGGVVQVHDGARCALDCFDGARNQVFARLGHDHEGHVLGDEVFVDEAAHKVKVGLRCGRKAHLDFLEADAYQLHEQLHLALAVHGLKQRLVAVAQIGGKPARRAGDAAAGPLAVGQCHGGHGLVFGGGFGDHHGQAPLRWCRAAGALGVRCGSSPGTGHQKQIG